MLKRPQPVFLFIVSMLAAASMWFYVDKVLVGYQVADAAAHDRPRGNLSDLYPRWLGARELLLHGRNPYSPEITAEIQKGYYGRVLDASRPDEPGDQQGFAYPVYAIFLLAPVLGLSFHTVQILFHWILIAFTAASVLLWLRTLQWRLPALVTASCMALTLDSLPVVQGIKLQQLSLLVAALLAASAASVAGGFLFLGGMFLALATIKPQLAGPLVAWLLIWAVSDWKNRRRLVLGFGATMVLLLVGSELVLPSWWRMFLEAIRRYHQYTNNESVLDEMVDWTFGRFGGTILAAVAALSSAVFLWRLRHEREDSREFALSVVLVLALTVMIIPMYSPYNQVLLLPAIFLLAKESRSLLSASPAVRVAYAATGLALAWPWMAALGLSVVWFASTSVALRGWKLPFYATLIFPVLMFALTLLSAQYRVTALRVDKVAR